MEGLLKTCDICYGEITNKVSLNCEHELCVMCFLVMTTSSGFKCHMCRKQHKWKKEETLEETLSLLIREDDNNEFRTLIGMETSKAFEVIVNDQNVIRFIVVLHNQMDTETLKFLISEFIANNIPFLSFAHDDIIQSLRRPAAFSHFKNIEGHLESFHDNLVIKKYEE